MRFKYLTFLRYSARGTSDYAKQSRVIMGKCKNGDATFNLHLANRIKQEGKSSFFDNATLIPIPRSTPMNDPNSTYPTKTIAETLVRNGLGINILVCLERFKAIPKSSSQYHASTRNKISDHLDSINVVPTLIDTSTIILIDDVLTLGRTSMACVIKLKQTFPDKEIKIFCPFRTRGNDTNVLLDVKEGEMELINNDVRLPD